MNKNKLFKVLIALVVVLGLLVSVSLVKKNQETRRGAAFTSTTLRIEPTTISGALDETKTVAVFLDTPRQINVAKVKVCYGTALELAGISSVNINFPGSRLNVMNYDPKIENNCVTVSQKIDESTVNSAADYPTGTIQLMNITFKVKTSGNLTIDKAASLIAGAPVNNDVNVPIDLANGATVTLVVAGGESNKGTLSFESTGFTSKKVGEVVDVNLVIDTARNFDAVEGKVCYGDKLSLTAANVTIGSDFTQAVKKTINGNCLDYTIIATGKLLTGKRTLANLKFTAVTAGNGTLVLSNSSFSNATDGTMTLNLVNANYTVASATANVTTCTSFTYSDWTACTGGNQTRTITTSLPANCTGGTPVLSQTCTVTATCTNGTKECVTTSQARECVNNAWVTTNCTSIQHCVTGVCQASSLTDAPVVIKMAFAGVKPGNDQCVTNWIIKGRLQGKENLAGEGVIYSFTEGVPQKTAETNSKGEIIYSLSFVAPAIPASGISDFSFFMKGPKHLSIKYGETAQSSWYGSLLGKLKIMPSVTNNYDFSNYSLLVGDVNGDGKINGQDFSLIKEKTQPITTGPEGVDLFTDLDGNCQVNAGDVGLIKESLNEINGQTY